jgi:glucose-1-phosphate cytidylyltransferase
LGIYEEVSYYGLLILLLCGYKQHVIKEYFADYYLHRSDITLTLHSNGITIHNKVAEPWKLVVATGLNTYDCAVSKNEQRLLWQ